MVGAGNPRAAEIAARCALFPGCRYHHQTDQMARLMLGSDLAIGAGGSATWERAFLGLPALVFIVADNQRVLTQFLHHQGALESLGEAATVTATRIRQAIQTFQADPSRLHAMSARALALFDDTYRGAEALAAAMVTQARGGEWPAGLGERLMGL
ncbi:hypothetical protein CCP4SC76_5390001 [Gammaproteobacteria bacterium]